MLFAIGIWISLDEWKFTVVLDFRWKGFLFQHNYKNPAVNKKIKIKYKLNEENGTYTIGETLSFEILLFYLWPWQISYTSSSPVDCMVYVQGEGIDYTILLT